ncbi:hypothetical protein [Planctomyces sp. SH-PL62]|uniref:hypothetical protein n=1 Tax=Planctomyces sp. SH-PL62 TaxID=1636152 RepID=UPI00078EB49A|nr:hypothetical protein [Planctomyces sp. SH-PL62]AMV38486.1 hypothetical protein VT85_13705 [Planctomyces sp. SH-PL62]
MHELFAALGSLTNFGQTNEWRLVADVADGGLAASAGSTARPGPSALALMGLGGGFLAITGRRMRRGRAAR